LEKISWADRDKHEEVSRRRGRKANWMGHILRRNCLLELVIEGRIEVRKYKKEEAKKREDTGN
jgi:hypothetical protein